MKHDFPEHLLQAKHPRPTGFEVQNCGRCLGSGRYSYNQVDGDVCYGCGGKGYKFTKRGAAVNAFFQSFFKRLPAELKVGDVIRCSSITIGGQGYSYWGRIDKIGSDESGNVATVDGEPVELTRILTHRLGHEDDTLSSHVLPGSVQRIQITGDDKQAFIEAAYAYDDTLTKQGKPRKRTAV